MKFGLFFEFVICILPLIGIIVFSLNFNFRRMKYYIFLHEIMIHKLLTYVGKFFN